MVRTGNGSRHFGNHHRALPIRFCGGIYRRVEGVMKTNIEETELARLVQFGAEKSPHD